MEVVKMTPQGYCRGVVNAINIAVEVSKSDSTKKPIYILGMIVHNEYVTNALSDLGLITIDELGKSRFDLLDSISSGTVIFTAHGVSDAVREKALKKGLNIIDASCKDVIKTHNVIKEKLKAGHTVLYVGKKGHPETESAISIDREKVILIEKLTDIRHLDLCGDIFITNQTTMSLWDIEEIVLEIRRSYPKAQFFNEICNATLVRQEAVAKQAKGLDLIFVVGDSKSNNTSKLVEVAIQKANTKAVKIQNVEDIDIKLLKNVKRVGVTSGASTPTLITNEIIEFLKGFDDKNIPSEIKSKLKLEDYLKFK